jgi:redox-sensitive bicupin YhaK (pirin superfamily)
MNEAYLADFNPSQTEPVHFLQIWITPNQKALTPRYEQRYFPAEERQSKLRLVVAPEGQAGALTIHQDAYLLKPGDTVTYALKPNRYGWLQMAQGIAVLNGETLRAGDGVQINDEEYLEVSTDVGAEILLFDLA